MMDFCQISLLSRSIFLFVPAAKFHNTGIFNDAFLRVNNGLLPNILVFTLNFSIRRQLKIPVYWNFYSVSPVTILCCFNSRVKWYLTWVVIAYYFNNRVSYYLTCLLFEHCKKHCEEVSGKTFSLLQGGSGVERHALPARCLPLSSLLRLKARTFVVLCPARFCGHPDFYCLSGFVDTTLLPSVHFCGHFYRLSTFVDTALLPSVHFCGHRAFTVCPLLWTPCFLLSVRFCGHFPFTTTQIPIYWNF